MCGVCGDVGKLSASGILGGAVLRTAKQSRQSERCERRCYESEHRGERNEQQQVSSWTLVGCVHICARVRGRPRLSMASCVFRVYFCRVL